MDEINDFNCDCSTSGYTGSTSGYTGITSGYTGSTSGYTGSTSGYTGSTSGYTGDTANQHVNALTQISSNFLPNTFLNLKLETNAMQSQNVFNNMYKKVNVSW